MTTDLFKALAQQAAMEVAGSHRADDGDVPDAVMLKRKPKGNLLWPEHDEVPEGALVRMGRSLPVVPVVRIEQRGKQRGKTRGLGVTVGVETSF